MSSTQAPAAVCSTPRSSRRGRRSSRRQGCTNTAQSDISGTALLRAGSHQKGSSLCGSFSLKEPDHPRPPKGGFFDSQTHHDPRSQISLRTRGLRVAGANRQGTRRRFPVSRYPGEKRCPGCGGLKPLEDFTSDRSKKDGRGSYCQVCDRERSRAYYAANHDAVLARAAAKRGPAPTRFCSECGRELAGRQRVTCGSSRCREARFKRLHPEAYAAREARKVERRRETRRLARERADVPVAAQPR